MIYFNYTTKQDNVHFITEIDSSKSERTPYCLNDFIGCTKIQRLDIPDTVLKCENNPIIDENYNLTKFGSSVMMSLSDNFADPFPKGYANFPSSHIHYPTTLSFHFGVEKYSDTFYARLCEALNILRMADPLLFFKEFFSRKEVAHLLFDVINGLNENEYWGDSLNSISCCTNSQGKVLGIHISLFNYHIEAHRSASMSVEKFATLFEEIIVSNNGLSIEGKMQLINNNKRFLDRNHIDIE